MAAFTYGEKCTYCGSEEPTVDDSETTSTCILCLVDVATIQQYKEILATVYALRICFEGEDPFDD